MKKFKGKDKLFGDVTIRQDGRVIHPMYLFEVKKPEELKYPYDYYKLVSTIPGRSGLPPARRRRLFAGEMRRRGPPPLPLAGEGAGCFRINLDFQYGRSSFYFD